MNPVSVILRGAIRLYHLTIPAITGPSCSFEPSCSEYAREAIAIHGPLAGLGLGLRRIARCHPWGGSGWDPVPPAASSHHTSSHHEACGHRH